MALSLVTGGAGFLGSHLVEALVARGDDVRVVDNLSVGSRENLSKVLDRIELHIGDLSDPQTLARAMSGVDYVFHFAAPAETPEDDRPGLAPPAVPTDTLRVLTASREAQVKRLIFASSGRVYGSPQRGPVREADATVPLMSAGLTKLIDEHHCTYFSHQFGLETVRLRYFNVFGPRQSTKSPQPAVLTTLFEALVAAGTSIRVKACPADQDWLYVEDAIYATLLAAGERRAAGKVYNVARGRSATLPRVASLMAEVLQVREASLTIEATPSWQALPAAVDIGLAERELGFCPRADLKQDLAHWVHRTVGPVLREVGLPSAQGPHFLPHDPSRPRKSEASGTSDPKPPRLS